MIIKIGDGKLFAEIETRGAELQRVYNSNGVDFLWNGDSRYWGRRAPVLFPICGGMKDDTYTLQGKRYNMPKHGFCREAEFCVESANDTEAVFFIEDNEERFVHFPFKFRFYIKYVIVNGVLEVYYIVENLGDNDMYFSVGSHEAYACPEGIESYRVEFEANERLETLVVANDLIQPETELISENTNCLPLKYDYFKVDALCFRNLLSKRVSLVGCGRRIDVSFDNFEFVQLWTKGRAPFFCIELTCGIDDFVGASGSIETKQGIITLPAGQRFHRKHSMSFSYSAS